MPPEQDRPQSDPTVADDDDVVERTTKIPSLWRLAEDGSMPPPKTRQSDVESFERHGPCRQRSLLVRRQTLALDDVDNVRRVHHKQERAQYGPLGHAELNGSLRRHRCCRR